MDREEVGKRETRRICQTGKNRIHKKMDWEIVETPRKISLKMMMYRVSLLAKTPIPQLSTESECYPAHSLSITAPKTSRNQATGNEKMPAILLTLDNMEIEVKQRKYRTSIVGRHTDKPSHTSRASPTLETP